MKLNGNGPGTEIIEITLVYCPAGPNTPAWRHLLKAQTPYTVDQALRDSGVLQQFPEIDLNGKHRIGIFGKMVSGNTLLKPEDRLEIYRPLAQDPKLLRIKRAKEQKKYGQKRQQ